MSTDAGRRARRLARDYRRAVVATVGILGVAAAGLGIASAFRPPHLADASLPTATALERPGQRLVLRVDQAIEPVTGADVVIEPETPVEVSDDGRAITLRFPGMLRARTEYRVRVAVRGAATGVAGTLEHSFATPDLAIAVLQRDLDGADRVVRRAVAGVEPETLFAADRIQEFALTRDGVAAIVLAEEGVEGRVVLARTGEDRVQDVPLPAPGRVQRLAASPTTGIVGFTFTATEPDEPPSMLLLADPADPSGVARPVRGLDGEPVSVLDWTFVPGTAHLVAQAFDESLLLVDTADPDAAPSPLGEHAELRGFLPGTVRLVVADPLGGSLLDLATGETAPFAPPEDREPADSYRGELVALGEERYAEVVSRPAGPEGFVLDYAVLLVDPAAARVVLDPPVGASVRDVCLSPNAQYLAVEVQDAEGAPDGYPNLPGRTRTTTYLVDLATGEANRGIAGLGASWC